MTHSVLSTSSDPSSFFHRADRNDPAAQPGAARRIAIVFQDFAAGGTERIMIRLANAWARDRDVAIFCGTEAGPARAAVSDAVSVIEVAPVTPRSILSRWTLGRRLAPLLEAWRPDVIVGPGNHVLPVFLAAGRLPAPIVCKFSNPIDLPGADVIPRALLAAGRRWACAPVSRIVAMSPVLRDEAMGYLRTDRVTMVAEPILPRLGLVRRRRQPAGPLRILFAGRLVAQKNVALALHTLAEMPDDATLRIVGDGPERARLEALAARLGLSDRITFIGHVRDIGPYLAQADIFLLPSRFEGYPAVLIEALAAGLPVVTTPCSPAIGEIVAHSSFGRIAPADPIALAAALVQAGAEPGPDPTLLAPLLARHGLAESAAAWLRCLDEATAGGA